MPTFSGIHVTGPDWRNLCDQALAGLAEAGGGQLAFLYLADELAGDTDRIVDYLRNHSGIPH